MIQKKADQIVQEYIDRIYAYVKKRVSNEADVEDVSQEIALNLYRALRVKEIDNMDAFVWTVAKNTLVNYYRGRQKSRFNMSLEDITLEIADENISSLERLIEKESHERIRREIAYLSKIQRKILIMYYYEEKKQSEIAELLNIPLGTVKWHLNVAKVELKKGMSKMRDVKDLKFNPITFNVVGLSGGTGTVGAPYNFVRSALSQNILYCIKSEYMTIEKIADILGVSPVYVESEIDYLEEYQLVLRKRDKYICNIIIEEETQEGFEAMDQLYERVSSKIANQVFDEIIKGDYLGSAEILGPQDTNFRMWSLMFYLLATVESNLFEEKIKFKQAATIRADGGTNIITASVGNEAIDKKAMWVERFFGPCWNGNESVVLWLIDGEWTEKRVTEHYGGPNIERDLNLLKRFIDGEKLSIDDYTFMLEKGYIRKVDGIFEPAIVVLKEGETKDKLSEITKSIKDKVLTEERQSIEEYKNRILNDENMPDNIKLQREFTLQYLFHSDGMFMRYAKAALESSGRLRPIREEQRKSVTEILIVK